TLLAWLGRHEVDLALVDVDAHEAHAHAVGEAKALVRALAVEQMARAVVLEVIAAELRDVHQAVDKVIVERHEQAEGHDAGDGAGEGLADVLSHVIALEPALDVAARVVGAPLGLGAVPPKGLPVELDAVALAGEERLDRAV